MIKQKVVRTYPNGWINTTHFLEQVLEDGYVVKFVTPVADGIIEYVVEKEIKEND